MFKRQRLKKTQKKTGICKLKLFRLSQSCHVCFSVFVLYVVCLCSVSLLWFCAPPQSVFPPHLHCISFVNLALFPMFSSLSAPSPFFVFFSACFPDGPLCKPVPCVPWSSNEFNPLHILPGLHFGPPSLFQRDIVSWFWIFQAWLWSTWVILSCFLIFTFAL